MCLEKIFFDTKKLQIKVLLGKCILLFENVGDIAEELT